MTIIEITNDYRIVDGPNEDELWLGLKYMPNKQVSFTLLEQQTHGQLHTSGRRIKLPASIHGMEVESGGGKSWNITVTFHSNPDIDVLLPQSQRVEAYYHSGDRKGIVTNSRPLDRDVHVSMDGEIWVGGRNVGRLPRRASA